ncbi:MAG: hypothetical protein EOO77_18430 [Oxalobacteraceae bacterium]|nr:MAG: hypothetical protein EOO77_18430 [Oxalobacteraceae bacterium]
MAPQRPARRAHAVGEAAKGSARVGCGKAAEGLIRDATKPDTPVQALLCTDLDQTPQRIVA